MILEGSKVTRGQTLETLFTLYLKVGSMATFHTYHADALYEEEELHRFWWRSKIICVHQSSKSENLVNRISSDTKHGYCPYLACRFIISRAFVILDEA